ncbi:MAG: Gfo/Idh/MocA family oxidoreductase [Planctomycetaceae bacterium]
MTLDRRRFLASTAATGLALATPTILGAGKAKRFRTALIGSGWWGMNILSEAIKTGQSEVVALCDCDQTQIETSLDELSEMTADSPKTFGDYREMLEQVKPEIVIVSTPDHWHALNTIEALKAGAHVFLEKPTGHTVLESRAIVNAAEQADRVVQVGLHRRIGPHHVSGMNFLKSGKVGDIGMVRMFVQGRGGAESPSPNSDVPRGLDWEMYCGPAPMRPFNRRIHPGGFRNFLDFANGTLGDWGVHWLDQLLWWTDEKYPKRVFSSGGRPIAGAPVSNDKEQTTDAPDSQAVIYEFESFTATWEHRKFGGNGAERHPFGCYFYGTEGVFHMGWRDGWTFYPQRNPEQPIHENPVLQEPDGHNIALLWHDFLEAIHTGKKPVAEVEQSHLATNLSLLGMMSWKLGRSIEWDGQQERAINDDEANALLKREYRAPWVYPEV